jgi:hypothetical protein
MRAVSSTLRVGIDLGTTNSAVATFDGERGGRGGDLDRTDRSLASNAIVLRSEPWRVLVLGFVVSCGAGAAAPTHPTSSGLHVNPSFEELVAKRATLFWIEDGEHGPACQAWELAPAPNRRSGHGAELVARTELVNGSTRTERVVRFDMTFGAEPDMRVTLVGPSWDEVVYYDDGHGEGTGVGPGGCADSEYQLVAREPDAFVMLADPPGRGASSRANDPAGTERWYTNRARCERDVEAKPGRLALVASRHHGC